MVGIFEYVKKSFLHKKKISLFLITLRVRPGQWKVWEDLFGLGIYTN